MRRVPDSRVRAANSAPVREDGAFVLYWMVAFRRSTHNYALDRAVEWARELGKPLLVFEPLRTDYPHASERFHRFVIDGMVDNAKRFAARGVSYYPYVEPSLGAGKGLLEALAASASVVVTDDYPSFFLPRMINAAASRLGVKLERVDSNGLVPLADAPRLFGRAYDYRRHLQKSLRLALAPDARPRRDALERTSLRTLSAWPANVAKRWPATAVLELTKPELLLRRLPIDHGVRATALRGGSVAARKELTGFVAQRLARYAAEHSHPDAAVTSGLSPYLHFGHVSAHEVFDEVARSEHWSLDWLGERSRGARSGFWQMSDAAEAFLDQLVTWRELSYHFAERDPQHASFASVPDWARATLAKHAQDARATVYDLATLERAATYDEVWNAAQRQLVRDGRIHNYLRMLWGKRVLEWTASAERAAETLVFLNDKYALDGRDPNSYSGIYWCFGRHDRPWGPERPVFGLVRYMSSDATKRKLRLRAYLERYRE